jgi:hypothetical protein
MEIGILGGMSGGGDLSSRFYTSLNRGNPHFPHARRSAGWGPVDCARIGEGRKGGTIAVASEPERKKKPTAAYSTRPKPIRMNQR